MEDSHRIAGEDHTKETQRKEQSTQYFRPIQAVCEVSLKVEHSALMRSQVQQIQMGPSRIQQLQEVHS
jgi:hypothetical protein